MRRNLVLGILCLLACVPCDAAVAFRAATSGTDGDFTSSAAPVVPVPAGVVDNDQMFLVCTTDSVHVILNVPTGWTQLGTTQDNGVDNSVSLFRRKAASEPASYTLNAPGNFFVAVNSGKCGIVAYSGVDTTTPVDATAGVVQAATASATNHNGIAITPSANNEMVVHFSGEDPAAGQSGTADTSPAATERLDGINGTVGYLFVQDFLQGTAAAVTLSYVTTQNDTGSEFEIALAPAGGSPAATPRGSITGIYP